MVRATAFPTTDAHFPNPRMWGGLRNSKRQWKHWSQRGDNSGQIYFFWVVFIHRHRFTAYSQFGSPGGGHFFQHSCLGGFGPLTSFARRNATRFNKEVGTEVSKGNVLGGIQPLLKYFKTTYPRDFELLGSKWNLSRDLRPKLFHLCGTLRYNIGHLTFVLLTILLAVGVVNLIFVQDFRVGKTRERLGGKRVVFPGP